MNGRYSGVVVDGNYAQRWRTWKSAVRFLQNTYRANSPAGDFDENDCDIVIFMVDRGMGPGAMQLMEKAISGRKDL